MFSLNAARDIINKEISNLILNPEPKELYDPIRYALSVGGKRLRPSMVLMACNLFKDQIDEAIRPALAIEIFHNFTLVHDDIMDDSPIRRGNPTIYNKWNQNVAILSGDVMSFIAYEQLIQTRTEIINTLIHIFNKTAKEVCEGQQYDMNYELKHEVSVSDYLKMIELKTAVLMGASLKIGSLIGGASPSDAETMYAFGKNLGMAFQLQDDMLDVYGDVKIFGKKIGGDIVANKKTYLLVKALELAKHKLREEVIKLLDNQSLDGNEKIQSVRNIYDQLNVRKHAQEMANNYFQKANDNLNKVLVEEKRKKNLRELAKKLMDRKI